MCRPVVLAILAIAVAARLPGQISPAADLAAGAPLTEPARAIIADVLARSILVGQRREIAAFIVQEAAGSVGCILWPRRDLVLEATFHGIVPSHTIALVHSHPPGAPPSTIDLEAARRLRIPNYVVTMTRVWFVDPEGGVKTIVEGRLWMAGLPRRSAPCSGAAPSLAPPLSAGRAPLPPEVGGDAGGEDHETDRAVARVAMDRAGHDSTTRRDEQ